MIDVLAALADLRPRPFIVVGGRFWTDETSLSASEFGADAVVRDPRELVAILRERVPPP